MNARFFYQKSTNRWLHRVDGNSPMTEQEAVDTVAQGFGLAVSDIGVVDAEATATELDALRTAVEWAGTPPQIPQPSAQALPEGEGLLRPTPVPAPLDPDDELASAIEAATTLTQLKDALLGTMRPARVRARAVEDS